MGRKLPAGRRGEVINDLYFEGDERRPYLWRFAILMTLSIVIATYGVVADSAPVVIGAMLVAPLMTPLLGLSAAMLMGWPLRQMHTALIVAAGSAGAIAVAYLASATVPDSDAVRQSGELLSRTSPAIGDLVIALAAGAAGAYVIVHREITMALPGAAVAVALVPPLAVIGVALELGESRLAEGATLLFLTNLTAIVLAAGVVFALTGFVAHRDGSRFSRSTRIGLAAAAIAVAIVAYPLFQLTGDAVRDAIDESSARDVTEAWIGESEIEIAGVGVDDADVVVDLVGKDRPAPVEGLTAALEDELGRELNVTARYVRRFELGEPAPTDLLPGSVPDGTFGAVGAEAGGQ